MRSLKLAVHICCAPDSAFALPFLAYAYDVVGYFYNPCIQPHQEYLKRLYQMEKIDKRFHVQWEEGPYNPKKWLACVKGLEEEPEGGKRCKMCIYMRLEETAHFARKINAGTFTTVLTNSPRKNAEMIFQIGSEIAKRTGIRFLPVNFKKHGWYEKSLYISRELGIYRQNYCGCTFSLRDHQWKNARHF